MCRPAIDNVETFPVGRVKIGDAGHRVAVSGPTSGLGSERSSIGGCERRHRSPELLYDCGCCRHAAHKNASRELHVSKPRGSAFL